MTDSPRDGAPQTDDLGLSIDMLDVDRLREWARLLLVHGADISHWSSVPHVVSKMQTIATGIEKAVRDIGIMRNQLPRDGAPAPVQSELLTVLKDMVDDLEARWDMNDRSTNPGIVHNVRRAKQAIARAEAQATVPAVERFPIPLSSEQEQAAKEWAADDRLWTTQETVEFNLRTFARVMLKLAAALPHAPSHLEAVKLALRALETGATYDQRRDAFNVLRDAFFPIETATLKAALKETESWKLTQEELK